MASWERLPVEGEAPQPVSGSTAIQHDGILYYFGGNGQGYKYFNTVWKLNTGHTPVKFEELGDPGGDRPVGRNGHTTAAVGQVMYVICGYTGSKHLNDVWGFDLVTHKWELLDNGNVRPRFMHSCAAADNKLYIYGGLDLENVLVDGAVLDLASNTWRELPSLNMPRCNHSATIHGRWMYIFGGYRGQDTCLQDLWRMNLDTELWEEVQLTNPPVRRSGHSALVHRDVLFVYGGFNGESLEDVSCIDLLGRHAYQAKVVGEGPGGRCYHASGAIGGKMYVFGGISGDTRLNDVYALNLDAVLDIPQQSQPPQRFWEPVEVSGDRPSARGGCAFVMDSGLLYLFGGIDDQKVYRNELYRFDIASATMTEIAVHGNPIMGNGGLNQATMVHYKNRLFIYGGYNDPKFSDVLWSVDPHTGQALNHTVVGLSWPPGRQGHSAVMWGDTLVVCGGRNFGGILDDVCLYDLSAISDDGNGVTWRTLRPPGPGTSLLHTANLLGSQMLLLGGRGGHLRTVVWVLDLIKLTWRQLRMKEPPHIPPRTGHTAVPYDRYLCVFGGYDGRDLGDVWLLDHDLSAESSEEGSADAAYVAQQVLIHDANGLAVSRCYHASAVWNDTLYVLFGCGDRAMDDILSLKLK